jgi:hypothetical protein
MMAVSAFYLFTAFIFEHLEDTDLHSPPWMISTPVPMFRNGKLVGSPGAKTYKNL